MHKIKLLKNFKKKAKPTLSVPARASLWYTAASFISRGITFAFTPIFTRILSSADYGIYPLYSGWVSVVGIIMTLEISGSVLYSGFAKFKSSEDFTKSALFTLISVFLTLSLPYFIFIKQLSVLFGLSAILLSIIPIHIISDAAVSLFCTRERYFYGYKNVFFANIIPALISPLLALLLISAIPASARPVGAMAASAFTALAMLLLFRKKLGKINTEAVKYVLRASISTLPYLISAVLLSSSDKILIGRTFGAQALAKYSVAHSLGLILTFATVGILGALKPWIMRKLSGGETKNVGEAVRELLILFSLLTAALTALAPELFAFLAPRAYLDALTEVYILALSVPFIFLSNVFSTALMSAGQFFFFSRASLISALLNIGLNIIFFSRFSFVSAAVSFLISYIILAGLEWCRLDESRELGRGAFKILLPVFLATGVMYLLRDKFLIRLLLLFALLPSLAYMSYKIFSLVREKRTSKSELG